VFRAFDRDIDRRVTLKVLTAAPNNLLADRFRREVAITASLHHANMIAIYELGEHAGLPFVAMEYPGPDDLRHAIQTQRSFTLLQKMLIMWQAAEGVRAAHRAGLCYVGVQPAGIALGHDGSVIIQDFGIVRLAGEQHDEHNSYASPEELADNFSPDPLCDVFSVGTIYYELLTGRHPFRPDSRESKIDTLNHEPLPLRRLLPQCPEALVRLVSRALNKQRELRYQDLDAVQHDAEPILRELKRDQAGLLLADGCRLMDARKLDDAQAVVRTVLELNPDSRKARWLHRRVQSLLQHQRVRSRQMTLLRHADEEAAIGRFGRAVEILESALPLDGANLELTERLEQMSFRLEQSHRSVQLVDQARQLLEQHCLPEARGKVLEALERDPTSVDATELLRVINQQEEDARVERELTRAKLLLMSQSFDAATSILGTLLAERPDSPVIEYWAGHARTLQAEAERQARLQVELGEARSLLEQLRGAEAVAKLEELRKEFPEEEQLSDLLLQAQKVMERGLVTAQAIAQCDQFRRAEQFDEALAVLDSALATGVGETAILVLRSEVEAQRREFRSAAAARRLLNEAQWLQDRDRPDLAVQLLRNGYADFSGQPDYCSKLATIEEMLPAWEEHRFIQHSLSWAADLEHLQQESVALTVLEEALRCCPASTELQQVAERLRKQERQKKLTRRLEMIRQNIAAQLWTRALASIERAGAEFPAEPELKHLMNEARAGLKRSECDRIITDVRQCLADGEADQAEEILCESMVALREESVLEALQEEIEAGKKYRDEWKSAQILFGRHQFPEAEQILVRLAAQNRPEVQAVLGRVRAARAANEEEQFYRRGRETALNLIHDDEIEQACDLLRNLLTLFPDDPVLQRDLRIAQGSKVDRHDESAAEPGKPSELQACEPQKEPPCQSVPAQLINMQLPAAAPTHARWAVIAVGAFLLFVSASAAWRFSRSEPSTPSKTRSAGQPRRTQTGDVVSAQASLMLHPSDLPPAASRSKLRRAGGIFMAAQAPIEGDNFQEPKLLSGLSPAISPLTTAAGIHGDIDLEATVDKQGAVKNVVVLSGHPLLVPSATDAVLKCRFQPATLNGQPLEVKVRIQIFEMDSKIDAE
jgi:hypothetical protein